MITSLDNIKTLLGITDNTQDAYLTLKMDIFEDYIVDETSNDFFDYNSFIDGIAFTFEAPNKILFTNTDNRLGFAVGDQVKIVGSFFNDGFYNIESVEDTFITFDEQTIKVEPKQLDIALGKVVYPKTLLNIMAFTFQKDMLQNTGITRRKEGNVDIQYNVSSSSEIYPREVNDFITLYRRMRW